MLSTSFAELFGEDGRIRRWPPFRLGGRWVGKRMRYQDITDERPCRSGKMSKGSPVVINLVTQIYLIFIRPVGGLRCL